MRRRREGAVTVEDGSKDTSEPRDSSIRKGRFYVVECDAYELPEFYHRSKDLIPDFNRPSAVDCIFGPHFQSYEKDWYGGITNWDEAERLLKDGWPEGMERVKALAAKAVAVVPEPESARRRQSWGESGFELDRDRLYSGQIETMWRTTRAVKMRAPRVIKLVGNWSMHAGTSANEIAWNSATLCAIADLLEGAGYQTEITLALPTEHYGDGVTMPVVRVKAPSDPLLLNTVAALGHAGVYRSFGFCAITSADFEIDQSLGRCVKVKDVWQRAVAARVVEPVDGFVELATTEREAVAEIKRVFADLFKDDAEEGTS